MYKSESVCVSYEIAAPVPAPTPKSSAPPNENPMKNDRTAKTPRNAKNLSMIFLPSWKIFPEFF